MIYIGLYLNYIINMTNFIKFSVISYHMYTLYLYKIADNNFLKWKIRWMAICLYLFGNNYNHKNFAPLSSDY